MGGRVSFTFTYRGKLIGVNQRSALGRKGRIVRSAPYARFIRSLVMAIATNCAPRNPLPPPVHASITFSSRHDVDGLLKPILDACEEAGLLANDRDVVKVSSERVERPRGATTFVTVRLWSAEAAQH